MQDSVYTNCSVATMVQGDKPYGLVSDATFVVQNSQIAWLGRASDLPAHFSALKTEDLAGRLVTPSLIDCHTHLVFGGTRANEFEARLTGVSYQEIAKRGGGIVSTVKATRCASDETLLTQALKRVDSLIRQGVAVIEVKSGYGLTIEDELRMLRVARRIAEMRPIKVTTTWLAAHALPAEYKERVDDYIEEVVIAGMKLGAAEGLIDAVDGFCEEFAFSATQMEVVFKAAKALGLPIKLHAEQLSDQKGALLCARYNGLSADHLEYLADTDVAEFSGSGAVAVLLPGAFYTLKETQLPPIQNLREHKVDIAIATDCNPGSSPISSILTIMNMACIEFSMTPEEALAGVTRNAAKALNLSDQYGVIKQGRQCDLVVWDLEHPAELSYWVGGSPMFKRLAKEQTS